MRELGGRGNMEHTGERGRTVKEEREGVVGKGTRDTHGKEKGCKGGMRWGCGRKTLRVRCTGGV